MTTVFVFDFFKVVASIFRTSNIFDGAKKGVAGHERLGPGSKVARGLTLFAGALSFAKLPR